MNEISNFFDILLKSLASIYPFTKDIYNVIGTILSIAVIHKAFYFVIGFLYIR